MTPLGFAAFVSLYLPAPPARILEIGCGKGDLALTLAESGHDVLAIDPEAPAGPIFQRVPFEDFADSRPFDALVASLSLHHVADLPAALDKAVSLLRPRGLFILFEFARERLEGATARWYFHERQALTAAGRDDAAVPDDFTRWLREWKSEHAEIHAFESMRRELDRRFSERYLEWVPYLYYFRLDDAVEPLERALIEEGGIEATGVRYVGERR